MLRATTRPALGAHTITTVTKQQPAVCGDWVLTVKSIKKTLLLVIDLLYIICIVHTDIVGSLFYKKKYMHFCQRRRFDHNTRDCVTLKAVLHDLVALL